MKLTHFFQHSSKAALTSRLVLMSSLLLCTSVAQADFGSNLIKQLGTLTNNATQEQTPSQHSSLPASSEAQGELSSNQIDNGLKAALSKGVQTAINQLGKKNGFLDDASVRIPMPGALGQVEGLLRSVHQEALADEFVDSMNHAAEKAVPVAASVFADAIQNMTVQDARTILNGPDDAATQYFRRTSDAELIKRFRPIVAAQTEKTGVTAAYKAMMQQAGPLAQMLGGNTNLDEYITEKALDGLFLKIAEEEKAIRTNPMARSSEILKQVFGSN